MQDGSVLELGAHIVYQKMQVFLTNPTDAASGSIVYELFSEFLSSHRQTDKPTDV